MLILTRKPGESLYIGDVKVVIVEIKGNQIRVGIEAPPEIRIYREEIYLQILEENKKAAAAALTPEGGLAGLPHGWGEKHSGATAVKDALRAGISGGTNRLSIGSVDTKKGSEAPKAVSHSAPQVVVRRKKKNSPSGSEEEKEGNDE